MNFYWSIVLASGVQWSESDIHTHTHTHTHIYTYTHTLIFRILFQYRSTQTTERSSLCFKIGPSVQFSRSVLSDSLRPHELQHARPPCPSQTPRVHSDSHPLSQWYHPAIPSSVARSPPTFNLSQHQGLFQWVSSSHQVAKVLEFQLQHWSFQWIFRTDFLQDWLVGSPCSPRHSQVHHSSTPQFKSINSLLLSFLYGPTLTSTHDFW